MNDLHELTKGELQERKKLYEMSFAYNKSENMAMWGLYSLPYDESLCIIISAKGIKKILKNETSVYQIVDDNDFRRNRYVPLGVANKVLMADIAYVSGERDSLDSKIKRYRDILIISENHN